MMLLIQGFVQTYLTELLLKSKELTFQFPRITIPRIKNTYKIKKFVEGERIIRLSSGINIKYSYLSLGELYLNFNYRFLLPVFLIVASLFSFLLIALKLLEVHANWYMAFPMPLGAICIALAYHGFYVDTKKIQWNKTIGFLLIGIMLIFITKIYYVNVTDPEHANLQNIIGLKEIF